MILHYKASAAGPYHIRKGIPCQDSCAVKHTEDFMIGVVADGVGSQIHSDIGSGIGAKVSAAFCAEHLKKGMTDDEIRKIMNNAFVYAYQAILEEADKMQVYAHDTTLCMGVYDGSTLYYFQSGDSGIVALLMDGSYTEVTSQQRDEEDRVFPLCSGPDHWEFGKVENVASVMLMTDGVLEEVCHPWLKNEAVKINVPLVSLFMARQGTPEADVEKLEAAAQQLLELYPENRLDDDKTVVVLWNNDCVPAVREESYYEEPDWMALQRKNMTGLYDEPEEEVLPDKEDVVQPEKPFRTGRRRKKKEKKKKRAKKKAHMKR
ncbi:MAG: protein phosphatase 2C domain-containing protein [Anaerotignum sp.]|nr:protein phosphatase 2C domain-containing protein [Anaerotignum sp.]